MSCFQSWPRCDDVNCGGYSWFNLEDLDELAGVKTNGPDAVLSILRGCGVGCYPCQNTDHFQFRSEVGMACRGRRFMRPDDVSESRSASGRYDWPISTGVAEAIRIPWNAGNYQLAMCYQITTAPQSFREFWDRSICNCVPPGGGPAPGTCASPDGSCHEAVGRYHATVFIHQSQDWPPRIVADELLCTGQIAVGSARIRLRFLETRLGNPAFIRHGHVAPINGLQHPSRGCAPMLNPLCMGQTESGAECPNSNNPNVWLQPSVQHHNFWNYLEIPNIAASWVEADELTEGERFLVRAKNRLVEWLDANKAAMPDVQGDVGLSNLDRVDWQQATTTDHWRRVWNSHPASVNLSLAEIAEYSDDMGTRFTGYLSRSRIPIIIHWIPWEIRLDVSCQWFMSSKRPACGPDVDADTFIYQSRNTIPFIKVKLQFLMGMYLEWADQGPHQLHNPCAPPLKQFGLNDPTVPLEIEHNDGILNRTDRIIASGLPELGKIDHVVCVDAEGLEFDQLPPESFEWEGEVGPLQDLQEMFDVAYVQAGGDTRCCAVAVKQGGNGIRVRSSYDDPIWPAIYDGGPNRDYTFTGDPEATIEEKRRRRRSGYIDVATQYPEENIGCNQV